MLSKLIAIRLVAKEAVVRVRAALPWPPYINQGEDNMSDEVFLLVKAARMRSWRQASHQQRLDLTRQHSDKVAVRQ